MFTRHKKTASELMTTAYLSVTPETSAEMVMARLRKKVQHLKIFHYIYVVDSENVLQRVVSIRSLLTARSDEPLSEIWAHSLISVTPETNFEEVVETFTKYKLQALPVLDKGNHLKGVIPFESVLDILLTELK